MRSSSRSLLVEELKRTLRGQKLTYAQVAHHLGLSLPTIKRMFSRGEGQSAFELASGWPGAALHP